MGKILMTLPLRIRSKIKISKFSKTNQRKDFIVLVGNSSVGKLLRDLALSSIHLLKIVIELELNKVWSLIKIKDL